MICALVFFFFTIPSLLLGLSLKTAAHTADPLLAAKYSFPILSNARTLENFSGKLPPCPWTPNCVNSQQKSCWGALYNVDPIVIPQEIRDPVTVLKGVLQDPKYFNPTQVSLVEESGSYLHYLWTVEIPTGALKGTYIDDVDIFCDPNTHLIHIRSASRKGFRDAVHLDFSKPGANKSRVEKIRTAFLERCAQIAQNPL